MKPNLPRLKMFGNSLCSNIPASEELLTYGGDNLSNVKVRLCVLSYNGDKFISVIISKSETA